MLDLKGPIRFEPRTFLRMARKAVHGVQAYFPSLSCPVHQNQGYLAREFVSVLMCRTLHVSTLNFLSAIVHVYNCADDCHIICLAGTTSSNLLHKHCIKILCSCHPLYTGVLDRGQLHLTSLAIEHLQYPSL